MSSISFGGLVSGLDTDSIIQQLISIESRPLVLLSKQRSAYQSQIDAYKDLNTRINALENKAFALTQLSNLLGKKATSSRSEALIATATREAQVGSYQVEVLQLATASRLQTGTGAGQGNTWGGLADISTDFSGQTINQINTANRLKQDVTPGTFFVNGQSITVSGTSTLNDIFNAIQAATGISVSLVQDPLKGGQVLQFSSASPVLLSNGTSNFLQAFKLDTAVWSGGVLSSTDAINGVQTTLKLDGSQGATNLAQTIGSGVLTINGVNISYNATNDSLDDILQRINQSGAGVTATFSHLGSGHVILTQKTTGPQAIILTDTGNLAAALGLTAADAQIIGQAAQLRVNGGPIQSFTKNTGIQAAGLTGVTLDLREADPGDPFTITVSADTSTAVSHVQSFVEQFNNVIKRINELTAYNSQTQERGVLMTDFFVNSIKDRLYQIVFGTVSGLTEGKSSGSLSELGISTGAIGSVVGTTIELQLDSAKLTAALENTPNRVAQLFGADTPEGTSPGIMSQLKTYLDGISNATGTLIQRQKFVNRQIDTINDRIEGINERLNKKQKRLEQQFAAMEKILSRMQTQQNALNNLLSSLTKKA